MKEIYRGLSLKEIPSTSNEFNTIRLSINSSTFC